MDNVSIYTVDGLFFDVTFSNFDVNAFLNEFNSNGLSVLGLGDMGAESINNIVMLHPVDDDASDKTHTIHMHGTPTIDVKLEKGDADKAVSSLNDSSKRFAQIGNTIVNRQQFKRFIKISE